VVRRDVIEEQTVAGQRIYRTADGWFVEGMASDVPFARDIAAALAELLSESPALAAINLKIAQAGGRPIPPRWVSEESLRWRRQSLRGPAPDSNSPSVKPDS
jgi:hypothetical protein